MSTGTGRAEAFLRDTLQPFMGREVEDLRHEELEAAANRLRKLRGMAHAEDMADVEAAASRALRLLKDHRRERAERRRRSDREDGRAF